MRRNTSRDVAVLSIMSAILIVAKVVLAGLPNIELVSFLIIIFTLNFGKKTFAIIPTYVLLEILIFGFNVMWSISYMYVWPLLFLFTMLFRKFKSPVNMAVLSGFFGLAFGFLCSFPLLFISFGGYGTGFGAMISYWIAGIPFDIVHGVSNFVIMLVLYKPVTNVLEKVK